MQCFDSVSPASHTYSLLSLLLPTRTDSEVNRGFSPQLFSPIVQFLLGKKPFLIWPQFFFTNQFIQDGIRSFLFGSLFKTGWIFVDMGNSQQPQHIVQLLATRFMDAGRVDPKWKLCFPKLIEQSLSDFIMVVSCVIGLCWSVDGGFVDIMGYIFRIWGVIDKIQYRYLFCYR